MTTKGADMKTVWDQIVVTQDPDEVAALREQAASGLEITHIPFEDYEDVVDDYNTLVDQYNDVFDAYVDEHYEATSSRYVLNFVLMLGAFIFMWGLSHVK